MIAGQGLEGGGSTYTDAGYPPPDGDGNGPPHARLGACFDPLDRFAPEQQCLQDAFPFLGRTGAVADSQLADAVVSYCGEASIFGQHRQRHLNAIAAGMS